MDTLIQNFHFIRPLWLLALLPALALPFFLIQQQRQATQWKQVISPALLPYLIHGEVTQKKLFPFIALAILLSMMAFALAGPTWKKQPQPVHQQASALVILWDLSPSMMAQDLKPSRMVRARLKLIDLLKQRKEGVTGLIAYAGEAHVVTPLTDDSQTIVSLLPGLAPSVLPVKGSNPEMALEAAIQLLKDANVREGDILFLTDGIDRAAFNILQSLQESASHRITVWGLGTAAGAPIPLSGGNFAKNRNGEIIVAKRDDDILNDAASRMRGIYVPFTNNAFDTQTVLRLTQTQKNEATKKTLREFDQWFEHGPYFLLALLPFAALVFRRGWLFCGAIFLVNTSMYSPNSHAFSWQDLWETSQQQGEKALSNGDYEKAIKKFRKPEWEGSAQYRQGNFEEALTAFEQGQSALDFYNKGNTLTQLGKYDEAIKSYDAALERDNSLASAKANRSIAEQLKTLKEQQQNQQGDGSESDNQQDQNGSENSDEQQSQDQQSGSENSQGNENSENSQSSQNTDNNEQASNGDSAQSDENTSENSDAKDGQKALNEDQKKALEQQYGQQHDDKKENEGSENQHAMSPEDGDQEEQEQTEAQQAAMSPEQNETASEASSEGQSVAVQQQPTDQLSEEQQALEQWLRKVPDDPSGLLRNKFRHEYSERRRGLRTGTWELPENKAFERW